MRRNAVETVLGAVVLTVAGLFVFFAYNTAQVQAVEGYPVTASFYKVGGLNKGGDVRISGIKVGTVLDLRLDPKTFDAVVTMSIAPDVKLPADTVAVIASEGVLGGKYVRLEPGTAASHLPSGGKIAKTRDFRSLEDQVGEIIFLASGGQEKGSGAK
jgi:phospholipid/cholesterol/gamma-HCH transport system substrate-binding protein